MALDDGARRLIAFIDSLEIPKEKMNAITSVVLRSEDVSGTIDEFEFRLWEDRNIAPHQVPTQEDLACAENLFVEYLTNRYINLSRATLFDDRYCGFVTTHYCYPYIGDGTREYKLEGYCVQDLRLAISMSPMFESGVGDDTTMVFYGDKEVFPKRIRLMHDALMCSPGDIFAGNEEKTGSTISSVMQHLTMSYAKVFKQDAPEEETRRVFVRTVQSLLQNPSIMYRTMSAEEAGLATLAAYYAYAKTTPRLADKIPDDIEAWWRESVRRTEERGAKEKPASFKMDVQSFLESQPAIAHETLRQIRMTGRLEGFIMTDTEYVGQAKPYIVKASEEDGNTLLFEECRSLEKKICEKYADKPVVVKIDGKLDSFLVSRKALSELSYGYVIEARSEMSGRYASLVYDIEQGRIVPVKSYEERLKTKLVSDEKEKLQQGEHPKISHGNSVKR